MGITVGNVRVCRRMTTELWRKSRPITMAVAFLLRVKSCRRPTTGVRATTIRLS